ncbi:hypothetical protein V2J09_004903 [Rumex salicifolius]
MGIKIMGIAMVIARLMNEAVCFLVFAVMDVLDFALCFVYRAVDFFVEAEAKPCYCGSHNGAIAGTGNILVSEKGESAKIVCLSASSSKLQLEDVSDTLHARPAYVSVASRAAVAGIRSSSPVMYDPSKTTAFCDMKTKTMRSTFLVEMLQGKVNYPIPRWSDCDCGICNSWAVSSSSKDSLFVRVDGAKGTKGTEDVLFIHGFISSSKFWTETVFPNLSSSAKSKYRLFAVDLLGFGRSPKPWDSLYTLREHVEMIERSVIEPYKIKNVHIVAHSLGCILALAIAVKYPGSVKSLTLLAPPYFKVPKGEAATQYVMKRVAPRRVWPPLTLGVSIACWYEHISRTICLLICRQHRFWCHTHNAAWHTFHNIICGTAKKLERYLDIVRETLKCEVTIFHGRDDELIPVECSLNVKSKIPRARIKVVDRKDHLTIVVGRQKEFARELEEIWRRSSSSSVN